MNDATTYTDEIVTELEAVKNELIQLLSSFSPEQINTVPSDGAWSPAQVGHHLYKSYKGLPQLLNASTKDTERDPAENISRIKNDLLNFQTKLKAPDFIVPELKIYDKELLLNNLINALSSLTNLAKSLDLTQTCTAFALPVYGKMTRLEWLYFVICHTKRHNHQLRNMAQEMAR
ncbi:MAG TPA: DinB family protein [Flavisolibacter sp.]|nr:DinB family protein [Flavisolibacter sp.]